MNDKLKVINKDLIKEDVECSIFELEGNYNFKPHIGQFSNGDIVMFVAHTHGEECIMSKNVAKGSRSLASHVVMYKSKDNGATWIEGKHVYDLMGGHEPSVTIIDDVLLVNIQVHGSGYFPDPYAKYNYTYVVVARSIDYGESFEIIEFNRDKVNNQTTNRIDCSRTFIKLNNGTIFLGLGVENDHFAAISKDKGTSWEIIKCNINKCSYKNTKRGFFSESVYFYSNTNRLLMLSRVDYVKATLPKDITYINYNIDKEVDNYDGEVLFESIDNGITWEALQSIGFPSLMYPSVVNINDKMLLTYTVREIPPVNTGCVHPKVGVQAIFFKELEDKTFDFTFNSDVIVIDDSTPDCIRNAGCFGNTIKLKDGFLLTPFSYAKIDDEVLKMCENKEYLNEEVFNKYVNMQSTYNFKYSDFYRTDKNIMEFHLRRNFSALFLYAQCGNKGGIATRVVKWNI